MGKKIISINEGKLSEFKLHSIWLRERLNGSEFVDQNNLQRLYEPSLLDDNLKDMYAGNCWGVPSFKITDSDGSNPFYVWGQDRMWLLKEEINKRLG